MLTAEFDYHLPPELIAQTPAARRDDARLLVVDRTTRSIAHRKFRDLPEFLRAGDWLVRNTARVLPARLFGRRSGGGAVECLLLRPGADPQREWWALLRPGRKLPPGAQFSLAGEFTARVLEKSETAEYLVAFESARPGETVLQLAERLGRVPLPPYIEREREREPDQHDTADDREIAAFDRERYQTVFADPAHTVAVAAPTAGLHFTPELIAIIEAEGVRFADVVLHVGLGTFRPIETERVEEHRIHREVVEIPAAAAELLASTARGGRRIAVGTTSVRAIEYYLRERGARGSSGERCRAGRAEAGEAAPDCAPDAAPASGAGEFVGEADLFIQPPYRFRGVDALITNFHLPRSTLLCLVAAFLAPGDVTGAAWLREIYAEAVRERYRFLSYGDAMLIL